MLKSEGAVVCHTTRMYHVNEWKEESNPTKAGAFLFKSACYLYGQLVPPGTSAKMLNQITFVF